MVNADPESAGLKRVERPGWAIGLVGLGGLTSIGSFFLGWFNVENFQSSEYLEQQGIQASTQLPEMEKELATPFEVVDLVKEFSAQGLAPYEPGPFGSLVYPWLALALTALCILLAVVAAIGLRHRTRSFLARLAAVALIVLTGAAVVGAYFDTGGLEGRMTYRDDDYSGGVWTSWGVEPDAGSAIWGLSLLLLLIGAAMGPRITYRLPDGSRVASAPGMVFNGPQDSQVPGGQPGQFVAPTLGASMQGFLPGPVVDTTTNISAIVSAATGATLCFAGYGFLPWGEDTTFSDIGEAAREYGFKDQPFVEAYFAWLGWAILACTVVILGLLALGRATSAVRPVVLRPILIIIGLAMTASHAFMWVVLADDGADFDVGPYAVGLGLLLTLLAALVPLKTSARIMVTPQGVAQSRTPSQAGQLPPWQGGAPGKEPPSSGPPRQP